MTLSARKSHALELFDGIAGEYDRWAQLLSFGNDRRWHDLLVDRLDVPRDGLVADVATGTAAVAIEIARRHRCRVVGIDQNPAMLERGRQRVQAAGLDERIELVQGEAESLPLDDRSVDALVHTYLLRYVDDPPAVLRELARVVRPGGAVASLEFGVPQGAWYPAWWAWTRIGLPTAGLAAGGGWYRTGRFLGPSIEGFWQRHPLEQVLGWWRDAGIEGLRVQRLSVGGAVIIRGTVR
ncbi:MAG: demethylmenaquinone methyltransferase / 2-methoxy-6-polyprenyl,4-benzoquinol methylase [Gaiellales bacterium]|jgi:demethylmenaquinone methyltransferase/2-methoxy-6-polyprenyl-1,4-benzoquinol methylase|nr:demethylmenaquinone methyltransferase / 2-methoxy-6-polyprenyl,4-benzoquinol methylase [Gaiellales bacterium]